MTGTSKPALADAGFDRANPLQLTLRHVTGMGQKINLAIAGMAQIGVEAKLHQSELRSHFSALRQGDFDTWAGWIGENNAEHYLGLLQSDIGNVNYGRFSNPRYDQIMRTAQAEAQAAARNKCCRLKNWPWPTMRSCRYTLLPCAGW